MSASPTPTPTATLGGADFASFVEAVASAVAEKLARPGPQLLDQSSAIEYVGISRSAWFRLRSAGLVPAPVHIEGAGSKWRKRDLDVWIGKLRPGRRSRKAAPVTEEEGDEAT